LAHIAAWPSNVRARLSATLSVLTLLVPAILSGCLSSRPESPAAESLDSLGITIRGVRESNIRLAYRDGLTIEAAADSIAALSNDRVTTLNAHLWKIHCIPVIRQIYSESDPLLSANDALAFTKQCKEYFISGLGKNRFGPYQYIAVNAVSANERRLVELNRQRLSSVTFDTVMSQLSRWAARHPLTNHVFERPSILNDLDTLLEGQDYSLASAIGRIADDVDDLSGRLSLFSAQLPRETRWQGEYVFAELSLKERLVKLDSTMTVLTSALTSIDESIKSGGLEVNVAGLQALRDDLHAALSQVSSERAIVIGEFERIRLATLTAAEEAANRAVAGWLDKTESIINRTLWKVGLFLSLVLATAGVLMVYLRRTTRG
jgi:hypothetical protein